MVVVESDHPYKPAAFMQYEVRILERKIEFNNVTSVYFSIHVS